MNPHARKRAVHDNHTRRTRDYNGQKRRTWKPDRRSEEEAIARTKRNPVLKNCIGSARVSFLLKDKLKSELKGVGLSDEMVQNCSHKGHAVTVIQ